MEEPTRPGWYWVWLEYAESTEPPQLWEMQGGFWMRHNVMVINQSCVEAWVGPLIYPAKPTS